HRRHGLVDAERGAGGGDDDRIGGGGTGDGRRRGDGQRRAENESLMHEGTPLPRTPARRKALSSWTRGESDRQASQWSRPATSARDDRPVSGLASGRQGPVGRLPMPCKAQWRVAAFDSPTVAGAALELPRSAIVAGA